MSTTLDLIPLLSTLATQSEAVAARQAMPGTGDEIPEAARAAWRHVLESFIRGEGIEAQLGEPLMRGIRNAGLGEPEIVRFFGTHVADEARHAHMVELYVEAHLGQLAGKQSFATRLLYKHVFAFLSRQCERQALYLLVPLLVLERTVSVYLTHLAGCAERAGMPVLQGMLRDIHRDEARHVAALHATCALLFERPIERRDRLALRFMTWVIARDMDRQAWWRPGLATRMAAIGLDAAAADRDNAAAVAEVYRLMDGTPRADRHAAV